MRETLGLRAYTLAKANRSERLSVMSDLSIKLQGYPENVQRIADVIDAAFPGLLVWVQSAEPAGNITIKIEGYEIPKMPAHASRRVAA